MSRRLLQALLVGLGLWLSAATAQAWDGLSTAAVWDPTTTRAFVVCLTRFEHDNLPSFTSDDRLDDRFVELLAKRGV
ncbi:MAG TPA: hypothetical protein VMF30_09835, partial [Pirellulales bacterium]|nr:hypothetical protein [Pirellulales bacterium]